MAQWAKKDSSMSVCKQKGKKMVRVKLTWQLTSIIDVLKTTNNNINKNGLRTTRIYLK